MNVKLAQDRNYNQNFASNTHTEQNQAAASHYQTEPATPQSNSNSESTEFPGVENPELAKTLIQELQASTKASHRQIRELAIRIAREVERICRHSDRIQKSGEIYAWQLKLARHRLQKCLSYYRLGSVTGRSELHSHLSAIVYRHIAPLKSNLGFQGRYNLIEDFLQGFYIESLRAFRREHEMAEDYTPRTRLALAEYMSFTEQYAKRRIGLPGRRSQQLILLRAQEFAQGQPPETTLDMELAGESSKDEEEEAQSRSSAMQQVRAAMVAEAKDPAEGVLRDRVIQALVEYLQSQGQDDCVDYLALKLQDLPASEIDEILNLSPRKRDYLQQRFKYHVEKFARSSNWKLVHQWLGADLEQNLGMSASQWKAFLSQLSPNDRQLIQLKSQKSSDREIAETLECTPKQVQKRWSRLLQLASQFRNSQG
jgi:hypothetical protein